MGLNFDLIGKALDLPAFTYAEKDVILYALGVGADVASELAFLHEKDLKVLPTFGILPANINSLEGAKQLGMNPAYTLHGEQTFELHRPIPTTGMLYTTTKVEAIYDKGDAGAVVHSTLETRDDAGKLICVNRQVGFDRSAGNFGGDRGPKAPRFDPPEGKEPDFRIEYQTSVNQAAIYRLSGDKNPLHIDPEFARKVGLDRPIMHGLCTFGFAGRAILHSVCGGDPARFKTLSVRMARPAYPGDILITEVWKLEGGNYVVRTVDQDGKPLLVNGLAETKTGS